MIPDFIVFGGTTSVCINHLLIRKGSADIPQPRLKGRGQCCIQLHAITFLAINSVSCKNILRNPLESGSGMRPSKQSIGTTDNREPISLCKNIIV